MFPKPYHPVKIERRRDWKGRAPCYTRTECPPRYFFIDFGLSSGYPSADGPHLELPIRGGDKTAPEHTGANYMIPCDPFATDIYYLGNLIRETFIHVRFEFRQLWSRLLMSCLLCIEMFRLQIHRASSRRHGSGRTIETSQD